MKKHLILILILFSSSFSLAQELTWSTTINGAFTIDSVTLNEDQTNVVNVSGKAGPYTVYMTYTFTNQLQTSDQGEYTAMAWAQEGTTRLRTTVRGLWKKKGAVYDMKHFENASDGNQLLTTGSMNMENKTYTCTVRFLD